METVYIVCRIGLLVHNYQSCKNSVVCGESANSVILFNGGTNASHSNACKRVGYLVKVKTSLAGIFTVYHKPSAFVIDFNGKCGGFCLGALSAVNSIFQHVAHNRDKIGRRCLQFFFSYFIFP